MTFVKAPCMGCTDRHFKCHEDCPQHAEWKSEENRKNAEAKFEQSVVSGLCEASTSNYYTVMDKHHRDVIRGHCAW